MNHYDTLEVSAKASPAVIKAAYKSLVQRYHPDKNHNDSESAQRTARLVQAYEVLSDETRRASYDRQLQSEGVLRNMSSIHASSALNRSAAYPPAQPQQHALGYWLVWLLIITTIVLAMWFLLRPSAPASVVQRPVVTMGNSDLRTHPVAKDLQASPSFAGERLVMREMTVSLLDTDKLPPGLLKILKIPELSIGMAQPEAKKLLWHLDGRKLQLRQVIESKLARAASADLMPDTGPKYIQELVWSTVSELVSTERLEIASQANHIEIELPQSFTVGLHEKNQLQSAAVK